jgi:hypothetical protein
MRPVVRPSARPFARWATLRLDLRNDCRKCRAIFAKGDAALPDGRTVNDGIEPDEFVCMECPDAIVGPMDETSLLAWTAWNLMAGSPIPEHYPSVEFIFSMLDLNPGTRQGREVYVRMQLIRQAYDELHPRGRAATDPKDMLAGTGHGEDDDE